MTLRLRGAVVGAGFVGGIHARALASHPRVELVGICGRTRSKTESQANRYGVPWWLSIEEMLAKARPHVVCIATGNKDHLQPSVEAMESGAAVLVEKPMAFTLEDARTMAAVANSNGVRLGVNFNHRFSGPYRAALQWLTDGLLGTSCYATMKFAGDLYPDLNDPYCQLIETQGHSFDLLRLFAGEIGDVFAYLADPRSIGVFTSAAVSLQFESGAVGTLLGSWDSSYSHPGAQMLEIAGTEGRLQVENLIDAARLFRSGTGEYRVWKPPLFDSGDRDFWQTIDAHIHSFVDAILDDEPVPVDASAGVRALEITFAAIRSFELGRPVGAGP